MKNAFLLVLTLVISAGLYAQKMEDLKAAIADPNRKVQAIHHYPSNIKNGQCHNVEVVSIDINGNDIKIVEEWSNWTGTKATTTLMGRIDNGQIKGTWESDYSSGEWTCNMGTSSGVWNKLHAPMKFGTFKEFQVLRFVIVNNDAVRDGFYNCR